MMFVCVRVAASMRTSAAARRALHVSGACWATGPTRASADAPFQALLRRQTPAPPPTPPPLAADPLQEKRVKRRVAVLVGYAGDGYSGSQVNPHVRTVEGDVFAAFVRAGAVTDANAANPSKVDLRRAARTDSGVHAATNVLSLKLEIPECVARAPSVNENFILSRAMRFRHLRHQFGRTRKTSAGTDPSPVTRDELDRIQTRAHDALEALVARANQFLPPTVRIFAICRVPRHFDPRMCASSRRYQYVLPTYLFLPPRPDTWMYRRYLRFREEEAARSGRAAPETHETAAAGQGPVEQCPYLPSWNDLLHHPFWRQMPPHPRPHAGPRGIDPPIHAQDPALRAAARELKASCPPSAPEEQAWLNTLYAALRDFRLPEATLARARHHARFLLGRHNFHNFTIRKSAEDPDAWRIVRDVSISDPFLVNGLEWVRVSVHGDSFMLHQIRKMVGMLLAVTRSRAPARIWHEAMQDTRFLVPMAPSEGLLLDTPVFDAYHRDLDERLPLLAFPLYPRLEANDPHEVDAFAQTHIYPLIYRHERTDHTFARWIDTVDNYHPEAYDWLNPAGRVPPAARLTAIATSSYNQHPHASSRTRTPKPNLKHHSK